MLDPNYILGLVDGEGSFTVYIRNPSRAKGDVKRRVVAEPKFYLKLIEKDKDILYELQRFFGCGNVYFQKDTRPNHQNCYRYEVASRKELKEKIIPFFEKHQLLLASKKNDFKIFCTLVQMIEEGAHRSSFGLVKMYEIKQTMH
ncbi:MAG: LAGLIDADG family homing endonuclease [Patescibacteria group bacterium]